VRTTLCVVVFIRTLNRTYLPGSSFAISTHLFPSFPWASRKTRYSWLVMGSLICLDPSDESNGMNTAASDRPGIKGCNCRPIVTVFFAQVPQQIVFVRPPRLMLLSLAFLILQVMEYGCAWRQQCTAVSTDSAFFISAVLLAFGGPLSSLLLVSSSEGRGRLTAQDFTFAST
jgi:hypothetical protein